MLIVPGSYVGYNFVLRRFPKRFTDPLEPTVIADMCDLLFLADDDPRCQSSDVYAFDFYPELMDRYDRHTPRQQVDDEIGEYLQECGDWITTQSDGIHRHCYYDLQSDGVFTLYIDFSKGYSTFEEDTGVVWDACTQAVHNLSLWVNFVCNPPLNP